MTASNQNEDTARAEEQHGVRERAAEALDTARDRAGETYDAARERAQRAYERARDTVKQSRDRTAQEIDTHPLGAVLGGLAIGAILAAVLPRTEREARALGNVGHKITDAARDAASRAAEVGREKVDEFAGTTAARVGHALVDAVQTGGRK